MRNINTILELVTTQKNTNNKIASKLVQTSKSVRNQTKASMEYRKKHPRLRTKRAQAFFTDTLYKRKIPNNAKIPKQAEIHKVKIICGQL